MTPIAPIQAVGGLAEGAELQVLPARASATAFSQLLIDGVESVDQKILTAEALQVAFVLDDSRAPHEATFAWQQAQLSMELLQQVRTHLLEGYQEIMRMQM